MTRVLHTADVHLDADHPERTAGLEAALDVAVDVDADVVTIGGDLFDRPEDVHRLRPALRNGHFANRPFDVLLIPGNHDVDAFQGDVFFGDTCTVLAGEPFEHWTAPDGDLRVTGLPYQEYPTDELLLALGDRDPFEGTEVLLLHCTYDAPFDGAGVGDEGTARYFPVTGDLLAELDFDHYLAGHHHDSRLVRLPNDATFAYAGTPASVKRSETGRRHVSVLDAGSSIDGDSNTDAGSSLGFRTLDTFHYASATWTVTPGSEDDVLAAVREWTTEHAIESAEASVVVDGFVAVDESEFHARLVDAAGAADVTDDTRGVARVREHPLYGKFETELDARDWTDDEKARVRERTLAVLSELAAAREL